VLAGISNVVGAHDVATDAVILRELGFFQKDATVEAFDRG
jgi:hypothetical protein